MLYSKADRAMFSQGTVFSMCPVLLSISSRTRRACPGSTGVVRLIVRVCARALCTVRIHRRVGAQVAGRSQRDILSASCTQEVTVPRDSRCTARQRKVCRATRRAPRCTCTADQAERVVEMSRRSAVQVDALHACCDGGMMAPPPHAAAAPYVLVVPRAGPQTHPSEWCSQRHVCLHYS